MKTRKWTKKMYREFEKNESVFVTTYGNKDIMIDLESERMEIEEKGYCRTKTRTALLYALLKGYIIPKEVMKYIEE